MSNSLRRSQSLKNLPGKTFATPCGPLVDKRKTVSQLVRQYQSYSDLRDIDSEDQISVPFRTTHEKTHNSSQSISWKGLASAKTGAYSGLTRSVSTDKLPSRHVKGTDALRALFETKSSNNASVKKDKTYQYFPVKDVCSACLKEVYPVEKVVADKCILHMNCFCCKHCKTKLSMHRYSTVYGDFYCTSHYQQLFKRNGNYDEGFGYQQHKDQWLPKKAEPIPETRSSSSAPNCQSTCVDSAAMVQTRISKEDRRVKTKVFQDNVKKLNIAWPPENRGKKKNLPLTKNMSEDSSIKTSRERVHSTNKVHPVQQTRIVKETTKQSLHPLSGMKSKYTGIPFEPKLQFYGEVKRAGSTFQHNKTSKTKTEQENVNSGRKHDTMMNVVSCAVLDGEQRVDEVCSDAICATKLNENTLCSDDGLTKDDIPPSNNLEECQEGCMTMPQSAIKLNETQCNISDESLSTADVELTENEVCSSLEKKNDAMFANKFNEDTLEMSSRCSNDGPRNNVILSSNYLEELQEGLMSLPPVDVCDGLKKNNHPPSISDDVYIKSDIPNSDNFPKKQERSQSNISTAPNDSSLKTCRSKETPDSSHPDKSYTTDIKHPMKTVNKSTSKEISPISKLFTSGPNEKKNPKHGIKNLPKRVNKLDCLLSKPFYPFTKKEKGLEKTQDTKTIPPEEKKKERTQEDKEKHVEDKEDYEGNKMNTERETFISLPSQDENNSAFSKTDMCDVAAFPKCDPGTLDQTPDNNSNLALCKTTNEDPTASVKEHDLVQENGQNSSQSQTRHHSHIFDPSILETETTADVNVDINISGTENASSEFTKDILETPDQKSTKNDIADLIDTNDSQSPIDGEDVLASQNDNFSPNANIFYPSGFETEVTVEVDVNSNIFTNAFVDIFDQESEVTTMTSDQICSQNETSNLADSSSNQSSVAGGNALAYQNDQFSHHADIFNSSLLETRATVEHRVDLNSNIGTNASNHIFDTQNASFENTKFILEMSDYKSAQNDISDLKSTNDSHDDNDSYVAGGNVIDSQNDHFNLNADIFNLSGLETKAVAEIRADVNSNVTTNYFNDILYTDSDVTTMIPDQKCSQNEISDLIDSDANQCSVADGNVLLSQNDIFNQHTDTFYPSGLEMETTDQNITENDISDLISTNQNQSSVVDGNPTHVLDDIFDTASSFSEMSDQKSTQNAVSDQSPVAGENELASQNKHFTHYADLIDSSGSETEATVEVKIDANSKITLNDIFDVESVSSDQHPVAERNVVGSQNDHFDLFDTDNKKSDLFDQNNLPQENSQFVQNDFLDIFSFDHESSTHVINGANQSTAASENKQFIQSEVTDSLCLNEDSSSALWQPSKTHHCPESLECIVFQNADNGADLSTLTLEPSRNTSDIFNDSNFGDTVLFEDFTVPSTQTNESISSKDDWLNDFLG